MGKSSSGSLYCETFPNYLPRRPTADWSVTIAASILPTLVIRCSQALVLVRVLLIFQINEYYRYSNIIILTRKNRQTDWHRWPRSDRHSEIRSFTFCEEAIGLDSNDRFFDESVLFFFFFKENFLTNCRILHQIILIRNFDVNFRRYDRIASLVICLLVP